MLVVDDQPGVCASLHFLLGAAGYKVVTAESGRAAIALAETECFDGALIDIHMPGMNGFDTCIALQNRAGALGRGLRVWFMTGAYQSTLETRCAELGGLDIFHKPFDFSDLLTQLERGLSSPLPSLTSLPSLPCVVAESGDDAARNGSP